MGNADTAKLTLTPAGISRVVEIAWEDHTSFEAIELQFGLNESAVVSLIRTQMKPSSFCMWRKRTVDLITKHAALRDAGVLRHRASHTSWGTICSLCKRQNLPNSTYPLSTPPHPGCTNITKAAGTRCLTPCVAAKP